MGSSSRVHRLRDMVLENLALHTVGAWLLCDDAEGKRALQCVPISFASGLVETGGWGLWAGLGWAGQDWEVYRLAVLCHRDHRGGGQPSTGRRGVRRPPLIP